MSPTAIILLANTFLNLAIQLFGAAKDDPTTPEEDRKRSEEAFAGLSEVSKAIAAYNPIPKG